MIVLKNHVYKACKSSKINSFSDCTFIKNIEFLLYIKIKLLFILFRRYPQLQDYGKVNNLINEVVEGSAESNDCYQQSVDKRIAKYWVPILAIRIHSCYSKIKQ